MLTFNQIIEKIDQLEEANVLMAALELRVFTHIGKAKKTAAQVARSAKCDSDGVERLLNALVAMGAMKISAGQYANTSETYKYLCESSPRYKKGLVMLRKSHRGEWEHLLDIIKDGRDLEPYQGDDDPEFRHLFTHAMHERSEGFADNVAKVIAKRNVGHLLDLGGGPGSYSAAVLKKDKKAAATLFDRSAAVTVAREIIGSMRLAKRFDFIEGDMFESGFGTGYDTVLFSNILHIYNPGQNKKLFRKIAKSLNRGGRLAIVDYFLKPNKVEPYDSVLFGLTMLLYTATGKVYTHQETHKMLRETGFGKIKETGYGDGVFVVEGTKL